MINKKVVISVISFAVSAIAGVAMSVYKDKHPVEVTKGSDIVDNEPSDSVEEDTIDDMEEYEPSPNDIYESKVNAYQPSDKKERTVKNRPFVISPEDYGEIDYYDQIEFMYMSDGILLNEDQEPVDNHARLIGDALNHFGEYEEDSVYVQNDRLKTYFAILKDLRKSTDLPRKYAH